MHPFIAIFVFLVMMIFFIALLLMVLVTRRSRYAAKEWAAVGARNDRRGRPLPRGRFVALGRPGDAGVHPRCHYLEIPSSPTRCTRVRRAGYLEPTELPELARTVPTEDRPEGDQAPDPGECTSSTPMSPPRPPTPG